MSKFKRTEVGETLGILLPATVAGLIESVAATPEIDQEASPQFLLEASALMHNFGRVPQSPNLQSGRRTVRGGLAPWQVNRLISYIECHLDTAIRARDLSGLIGISVSHFFRGFKNSVGVPPFRYITVRRVARAQDLIRTTPEPLSSVAIACGLCDQAHLCRLFRRIVGQSPSAWRRVHARGTQAVGYEGDRRN